MKDWKFLFEKYVLGQHDPNKFPEPQVLKVFKRIHGALFVDIGANVGRYDVALSQNFSSFYAFEPNPYTLVKLKENLGVNFGRHYTIFPIALSNEKGRIPLYLDAHRGFSGSADTILPVFEYKPNAKIQDGRDFTYIGKEKVEVDADRYDNLVSNPADLVKIDVEGAEFLVLEGMRDSLKHGRIKRIMVELHNRDRDTELEEILTECSFYTCWIDPDRIFGELGSVESVISHRTTLS